MKLFFKRSCVQLNHSYSQLVLPRSGLEMMDHAIQVVFSPLEKHLRGHFIMLAAAQKLKEDFILRFFSAN